MFSRLAGLILMIAAACATCAASAASPRGSGAAFDPIAFFIGRTHGEGELNKLIGKPVKVSVDSVGRRQGDTLSLVQTIHEGDKPARARRWTMKQIAAGRYTGTLTDAVGPVQVIVTGSRASIRYRTEDGLQVEQQLTLQRDGKPLLNRMRVRKFGLQVATLEETIRKLD